MSARSKQGSIDTIRRGRLGLLFSAFVGLCVVLVVRLFYLQVTSHDYYSEQAALGRTIRVESLAQRGEIRDASGNVLAQSVRFYSIFATPSQIKDPRALAQSLSAILGEPPGPLEEKLSLKSSERTLIKAGIDAHTGEQIRALFARGVTLDLLPKRVHPEGELAAIALGIVDPRGQGRSGIELMLDGELRGKPGYVLSERDGDGGQIAASSRQETLPVGGADVILTIDRYVQTLAERELKAGVADSGAKSGSAIVLDPRTGRVLALASYPHAPLEGVSIGEITSDQVALPWVQSTYEPGAPFLTFALACAIDRSLLGAETLYPETNELRAQSGTIRNGQNLPTGLSSVRIGFLRSSNVAGAYLGSALGKNALFESLRSFGFGKVTGVGLPDESAGVVVGPDSSAWNEHNLLSYPGGAKIETTPLQMASGIAAIANGGTLLRPYIVAETHGPEGDKSFGPTLVRQALKADSAKAVRDLLVESAKGQESRADAVALPGYSVAGKAGRSVVGPTESGESPMVVGSYVGFAPADDPAFVILVKLDGIKVDSSADSRAAGVFANITQSLLRYYGIRPGGQ